MLDPIFDLLAGLLAWFYSLVPSYGFAIIALTTLVLAAMSPLTYRSTKSMVQMRQLQPQIKRLQKKYKGDRETLNQEMMKLYQEHNVSPLSGCLPILVQSPVFIVMFRVIGGVTRKESDIGFTPGGVFGQYVSAQVGLTTEETVLFNEDAETFFNPEYLSETSDMYQSLIGETEMGWIGLDLSRSPWWVLQQGLSEAFPYLIMIALVAGLGWYQQQQIQGRMTGEVSSQQQMIMRILPWMLPIFAFTMPAGLVLYFIVSALLRIIQQAYITRTVYGNEELTKVIELDDDPDFDDDDDDEDENPLAALFGGKSAAKSSTPAPSSRHGSRRPTSGTATSTKRSRPAKSPAATKSSPSKSSSNKKGSAAAEPAEKVSGWGRAKRSAQKPSNEQPEKPVSRRVTPKSDSAQNRRGKK